VVGERVDFFVSHAGADRAWAEWVAWQLTHGGYTVVLDVWDWAAGQNFVTAISDALDQCDRVVALFSAAYFERSRYTREEWTVAALHVPGTGDNRLVPVRVEDVPIAKMPAVLRPLLFCDLFGVDADQARRMLLEAVTGPRRPNGEPQFPGPGTREEGSRSPIPGPPLPGSMPQVWNLSPRNQGFTGRDGLLVRVRERLLVGDKAVIQALQGMGGVGKTQLAVEYAYQFAAAYDLVWWINAEQAELIGDQFVALASELDLVRRGESIGVVRARVLGQLRQRERWLLVFDNAKDPADIMEWLPTGSGHVLITSRERNWVEVAKPVEVDVLARTESVAILQDRVLGLSDADADRLAEELGDLPLAIAQAAGFMSRTGTTAGQYLEMLWTQAGRLLDEAKPEIYPDSLAAATQLIADRLGLDDPAAAQLASLCAFLAPELIPEDLFTGAVRELPSELAVRAADPLAWRRTLAHMAEQSLARIYDRGLQLHRLTQAILRDRLTPAQWATTRERMEAILAASDPGNPANPITWPRWAQLMPHLLVADLASTENRLLRRMACNACWYLMASGDTRTGLELASYLRERWRERFGDDDENTLAVTSHLARMLRNMGRSDEARDLDESNLDRMRVLGEEDPDTLSFASNLAADLRALGDLEAACDLDWHTLERRRRVLGMDHPKSLHSASNLAHDLRALGDVQAARELDQDTLERVRRLLGADHPDTLGSAINLAIDLYQLGNVEAACHLDQDTLERLRRVLGADHPDTLGCANNLALDLRTLGDAATARDLDQDTFERRRQILGADHPDTLGSASNLAADQYELGDAEAALRLDRDTLERMRRLLGADHPDTLGSASNLALDLRTLGDAATARDLDQDTFERRRRVLGPDHPDTLQSANDLDEDLNAIRQADNHPGTRRWLPHAFRWRGPGPL
jgi:TIR domain/Tetratricopeptide repeat/NB-ARC domain